MAVKMIMLALLPQLHVRTWIKMLSSTLPYSTTDNELHLFHVNFLESSISLLRPWTSAIDRLQEAQINGTVPGNKWMASALGRKPLTSLSSNRHDSWTFCLCSWLQCDAPLLQCRSLHNHPMCRFLCRTKQWQNLRWMKTNLIIACMFCSCIATGVISGADNLNKVRARRPGVCTAIRVVRGDAGCVIVCHRAWC